ncbi:uncharacterized protein FTOL_08640 [Fusarium torulosum]|uniref:Uncharacterized protein n=1 Tax=Fusarium torulosum TaxID=33205 RepID=A0AAE8ME65_9HYPO|nr:uncharacterized protein FTOL_08640 [Fusarium torulosum]
MVVITFESASGPEPNLAPINQFLAQTQNTLDSTSRSTGVTNSAILAELRNVVTPQENLPTNLPSLADFDKGVEDLHRTHGAAKTYTPQSPQAELSRNQIALGPLTSITQPQPSWPLRDHIAEDSTNVYNVSRSTTLPSPIPSLVGNSYQPLLGTSGSPNPCHDYAVTCPPVQGCSSMVYSPTPLSQGNKKRRKNPDYTKEEGDFIIYTWYDRGIRDWIAIHDAFARQFDEAPERSQGALISLYYRLEKRIPVWDEEGKLCFDNEDDIEPRFVEKAGCEAGNECQHMKSIGLAQRYPERAINYSWVDLETKCMAQDWADKRVEQYRKKKERRQQDGQ